MSSYRLNARMETLVTLNGIVNKLRGRRVPPTRYAPARVQEHNFSAL